MSNEYHDVTEKMKERLKSASSSMCLAKWNMVSMHLTNGKTHSCYHPPTHDIPLEGLSENPGLLHNTPQKIEERAMMRKGERPKGCSYCWRIEDAGHTSDRHYRSSEWWNSPDFEKITLGDAELDASWTPAYVEVNFNQACNFKCLYCSPHLSSAWEEEIVKHGPISLTDARHNDLDALGRMNLMPKKVANRDNPYVEAFWKWWPDLYKNLKIFRMTGGEPLMDKNTFHMFDYVKNNPKKDLHLSITSNCCPPGDQWNKFINELDGVSSAIDHFMLFCSLDSWGPQAEYIRDGLHFETLNKNIREYLIKGKKHSLTFIVTFNVLSFSGWLEYVKNIHALRNEFNIDRQLIWFDIPQLSSPNWMDPRMAKDMITVLEDSIRFMQENKETESNRFKGFKDYEISKVQRLIDWITLTPFDDTIAIKNFYLYFLEHDRRRGTDFQKTFPELNNLWIQSKGQNE